MKSLTSWRSLYLLFLLLIAFVGAMLVYTSKVWDNNWNASEAKFPLVNYASFFLVIAFLNLGAWVLKRKVMWILSGAITFTLFSDGVELVELYHKAHQNTIDETMKARYRRIQAGFVLLLVSTLAGYLAVKGKLKSVGGKLKRIVKLVLAAATFILNLIGCILIWHNRSNETAPIVDNNDPLEVATNGFFTGIIFLLAMYAKYWPAPSLAVITAGLQFSVLRWVNDAHIKDTKSLRGGYVLLFTSSVVMLIMVFIFNAKLHKRLGKLKDRLKSLQTLLLLFCIVFVLIGGIIVWSQTTTTREAFSVFVLIVGVFFNTVGHLTKRRIVFIFTASLIFWVAGLQLFETHLARKGDDSKLFAGYVMLWIGLFASFLAIPAKSNPGAKSAPHIAAIAIVAILLAIIGTGLVFHNASKDDTVIQNAFELATPVLLSMFYFICAFFFKFPEAQIITAFTYTLLPNLLILAKGNTNKLQAGFAMSWISVVLFGLILMIEFKKKKKKTKGEKSTLVGDNA